MLSTQHSPQILSLPAIHAQWTAALSFPPTAQLSTLRRLVRAVTKDHHPALRPLSLAALGPLYLDLALAYAFLGEYYLASKVFTEAVDNDPTNAVAWFGLGLAQTELADWRNARRSWKECLRCFGSVGDQEEGIHYTVFQAQDERMLEAVLGSEGWTLERRRVEFNLLVALREKGSKKRGVAPRPFDQQRPGLNGIPAGLRFGPGWDASLLSLDSPPLAQYSSSHIEELGSNEAGFTSNSHPAARTPPSSNYSRPGTLPRHISSQKPLPALPRIPSPSTPTPSLADQGSLNDHKPLRDKDISTSSPERAILDPFSTSPQILTVLLDNRHHERFSRQSTLCTPEDDYFYDRSDDDDDDDDDVTRDTYTAIDDTIASWSSLGRTREDQIDEDPTLVEDDFIENENSPDHSDMDGEILRTYLSELAFFLPLSHCNRAIALPQEREIPPPQKTQLTPLKLSDSFRQATADQPPT